MILTTLWKITCEGYILIEADTDSDNRIEAYI